VSVQVTAPCFLAWLGRAYPDGKKAVATYSSPGGLRRAQWGTLERSPRDRSEPLPV